MFANLKNKIIEEVKASPSKFQQFANAAQAAVSSSTSTTPNGSETTATTTTNENFFSITEEDTPQNSPYKPLKLPPGAVRGRSTTPYALNNGTGAVPRTRKLSNSSMASDVSFRLPSYDASSVYHLQSDLDFSGSEMDDSASTTKLDIITKEQLYEAYKKSLDRYNKYRCRYTDLAKKYKDLERDSTKARSVLVETQEKAIRRISELREQCTLEQQAKAHLEEALRMEMDDMQCKMQAYQTKLKLLGENPENIPTIISATSLNEANSSLIDLENNAKSLANDTVENNLISLDVATDKEHLSKIQLLENELKKRDEQLKELTIKMQQSKGTIELLKKQEEENALLLAQTKQAIHSELENKESEVNKLKDTIKELQTELNVAGEKQTQLTGQVEGLTELKDKLKQTQMTKQEIEAKLIATEHMLSELKEQYAAKDKALATVEEKLNALSNDNEHKIQDLLQQNAQLNQMVQRYQQNEISLAEIDNELNRTKNEHDILKATAAENERKFQELESELNELKDAREKDKMDILAETEKLELAKSSVENLIKQLENERTNKAINEQRIQQLEAELRILNDQNTNTESETINALKLELTRVNAELGEQLRVAMDEVASKERDLKAATNKFAKQKKQQENQANKIREQNDEIEKLRGELNKHEQLLQTLQIEAGEREQLAEIEKNELKMQVSNILHEISQMEEQMRVVQHSHAELETEKGNLEIRIEDMQRMAQKTNEDEQRWREEIQTFEEHRSRTETQLQAVQSENSQLAERNCLLEEKSNRLEKLIAERDRQQSTDVSNLSEMRLKLETAEDTIEKLQEKMSQVLDENSRMHNAQELMDHDYRSLQDKIDTLEKEKLLAEDNQKLLQSQLEQLEEDKRHLEDKLQNIASRLQEAEENAANENEKTATLASRLEELQHLADTQLCKLQTTQSDDDKLRDLLQEKQKCIDDLQMLLNEREQNDVAKVKEQENEIATLREQINVLQKVSEETEKQQSSIRNEELAGLKEEYAKELQENEQLNAKLQDSLSKECDQAKTELAALREIEKNLQNRLNESLAEKEKLAAQLEAVGAMDDQLNDVQMELMALKETERELRTELAETRESYTTQLKQLEAQLAAANTDVEKLHESNDALQVEMDKYKNKHQMQVQDLEKSLKQLQDEYETLQLQQRKISNDEDKLGNYEQMLIENEYLNNHAKQLENELAQQKEQTALQVRDGEELKEKLKSIQCELYVLKEDAEKHNVQLAEKQIAVDTSKCELDALRQILDSERKEWTQQSEHTKFITEQNDTIQKDLLLTQNQLTETEQRLSSANTELMQLKEAAASDAVGREKQLVSLHAEVERNRQTIETLNKEVTDITEELKVKEQLQEDLKALRIQTVAHSQTESTKPNNTNNNSVLGESEHLRRLNEELQRELEDLKCKSTAEIRNLQQEIEDMQSNSKHMNERLMEFQRQQQETSKNSIHGNELDAVTSDSNTNNNSDLQQEKEELEAKLRDIMTDVQEVSNRNVFLEQKCENYLILEQSNERLKLQNAKLSRQLDETLVSMQHNENITANTEFEYLRNIMFQYLTGSANGNNETLVKVISAVLKFSAQQTQVALEKEHQRRSLINKIL